MSTTHSRCVRFDIFKLRLALQVLDVFSVTIASYHRDGYFGFQPCQALLEPGLISLVSLGSCLQRLDFFGQVDTIHLSCVAGGNCHQLICRQDFGVIILERADIRFPVVQDLILELGFL